MLPPIKRKTIREWISENHRELNQAVRQRLPKSTLKSNAIRNQQFELLYRFPALRSARHCNWVSLQDGRRSSACRFEWARLQMFIAARVLPALSHASGPFHHVIVASKRWRVEPTSASNASFAPPRRKVRAAIQKLRDKGFNPVFVAAYELSGDRALNGPYSFEPHVHLLIAGVPKDALKAAFRVRLRLASRGRDKPLHVAEFQVSELGNLLGYLTKMKPQDRVEYIGSNGRTNRTTNRMPAAEADRWLHCMSTMPIAQTIQFGGFTDPMTTQFTHLEMATIIGDLK
jgi:hypothetical protein